MSALNDLVAQIEDASLRERIAKEVERLSKQKKFGLVFEDHLPECSPLYDIPVKVGAQVARKTERVNDIYRVLGIKEGVAECLHKESKEVVTLPVAELVTVAEFGEPIYPYLKPLDSVCNSPESDLWHTLIEADNYHALQLLEYLYAGKVDCIYIDPPYNSGAKDWKYNNDYVDSNDSYRHSKWLSFMQKRLQIARKLLNPKSSILIVTIDEKEYLHLGCLLEELFPDAKVQMISSVINRAGTGRKYDFSRTDEYLFFVRIGESSIALEKTEGENTPVVWDTLRRSGPTNTWATTKSQFYPIFVEEKTKKIHSVGLPLVQGQDRMEDIIPPPGCVAVFPIRDNGLEMMWGCVRDEFLARLNKGYIRVGKATPQKPQKYIISYLTGGIIADIESGKAFVESIEKDGSVNAFYRGNKEIPPTTNWNKPSHDAQWYGSKIIKSIIGANKFSYPKSLYAVRDCLYYATASKKDALIVDFFAGSGTTLHAVNLLNAEDCGSRRCIMVTNNEVSNDESRMLIAEGVTPGDEKWDALGVARYVTWPRTVCSIKGVNISGEPLKGSYLESDIPMSNGFAANAVFFKLGFLDKTAVALGQQFREMLPTLWMKAGARGKCPEIASSEIPSFLVLPENNFAVLVDERYYMEFVEELDKNPEIETIFIVTDSDAGYRDMIIGMEDKNTYQLYRDYLDNFRINSVRR